MTGQKNRIVGLLKRSSSLDKAKAEISKLNEQIAFFKEERERWALEKESLLAEKNRQDSINQTLNSRLDESKQTNDYLTSVTRDLTVEKSKLEKEKSSLAKKVDKASMIKADKISVKTLQKKDNGKNVTITAVEKGKTVEYKFDKGLIAVGMTGVLEGFGLEKIGIDKLCFHHLHQSIIHMVRKSCFDNY